MLLIHSIVRWIVVIAGVIVVIKFLIGWLQNKPFTSLDRRLSLIFTISMDVEILLGIVTLFTVLATGIILREHLEHAFVMILALVAVHLPMRWRDAPDQVRFRNTLISFVVALVLIFIGVSLLPGGWARGMR